MSVKAFCWFGSGQRLVLMLLSVAGFQVHRFACSASPDVASRPNILIVTVDDMSCDSVGAYGCRVADTTPAMDAFAATALRFNKAHVLVGNCMPGRNLMWSGLYSHVNGVEGFRMNRMPDYPVLCDLAQDAGYFTAIRGKASHSTPYHPYAWDAILDTDAAGKRLHLKDVASYGDAVRRGIQLADDAGKPFCLMVNLSDPHKPFYTQGYTPQRPDPHVPSKVFTAADVAVPGFLFDDRVVRDELALYYSSVRRADDALANVLRAVDDTGMRDETFVMFLSDHGMPLPFAKTQLYHHSTHTPLMVRWPGVTTAGSVDDEHMISAIDFLPTLLDVMAATHPTPDRLHGRSFAKLLRGQTQTDRDYVIKQYNENSGRWRQPMRAIQTARWLYLYNPWSDGSRVFATATNGTKTCKRMKQLATSDPAMAARLDVYEHRSVEELYNIADDPDCLNNLLVSGNGTREDVESKVDELRGTLAAQLTRIGDPVAAVLRDIRNEQLRRDYMAAQDAWGESLRNKGKKARRGKQNK